MLSLVCTAFVEILYFEVSLLKQSLELGPVLIFGSSNVPAKSVLLIFSCPSVILLTTKYEAACEPVEVHAHFIHSLTSLILFKKVKVTNADISSFYEKIENERTRCSSIGHHSHCQGLL